MPLTLHPDLATVRAARREYRSLSRRQQLRLVQELAATRRRELVLAHPGVLDVAPGYRLRGGRDGRRPDRLEEVCLGFIVDRKWPAAEPPAAAGPPIPGHLLAFVSRGRRRVLCAVPTDVRERSGYGQPVPKGGVSPPPYAIVATNSSGQGEAGMATCVVSGPDRTNYLLGCRHVFTPCPIGDPRSEESDLAVWSDIDATDRLATTTSLRGAMDPVEHGFDAQLARLDVDLGDPVLRTRIGGDGFSLDAAPPYTRVFEEIPPTVWILTGRADDQGGRRCVEVQMVDQLTDYPIPYPASVGGNVQIVHATVLHGHSLEPLLPGDSGSPVVRLPSGNRLVGMFIAGDAVNVYFLPTWDLLAMKHYGMPDGANWKVVDIS
jgi:hypothetical protein